MQTFELGVRQAFFSREAFLGVEGKHLREQVESHRICVGLERGPVLARALWQTLDVPDRVVVRDLGQVLLVGGAEHGDHALDLL